MDSFQEHPSGTVTEITGSRLPGQVALWEPDGALGGSSSLRARQEARQLERLAVAGGDAEWPFLTKSNVRLPCSPALPLLGVCPLVTCTTVPAAGFRMANEGNSPSVLTLTRGQQRGGAHTRCPVTDPEHTPPREGTRHERPQSI